MGRYKGLRTRLLPSWPKYSQATGTTVTTVPADVAPRAEKQIQQPRITVVATRCVLLWTQG